MGKRSLETSGVPGKRRRKSLSGEKQETDRPKLQLPHNFSSFTPSTRDTPVENCENVRMAQRGIFDFLQKHGVLCTANFKTETTKADIIALYGELLSIASTSTTKTRVIVGFDPKVWKNWNPGMELELRPESENLLPNSTKLVNDGKDVLFYIKSEDSKYAKRLLDVIENSEVIQLKSLEIKHSDENGNHGILGGEYREGLTNVSSLEALSDHIVIDETGKGEPGGTYILNQIFQIDWTSLRNAQQASTVETIVGRKMFDFSLETTSNRQCHIVRVNEVDFDHQPIDISSRNKRIFRQSMPYGKRKDGGREEGIMFIATANSTDVFTDLLKSMIGNFGTCEDALLNYMVSISGSFYYAPSIKELNLLASGFCRLQIDPFWQLKPKNNDFLFYNHTEYLHRMSERDYPDPPSSRVIRLMDFTMENWRKSWFQHIPVPDIPDLGSASVSIQIRKSLAIKKTLSELVTTDDIPAKLEKGFYGVNADVFSIHPDEIIVGKMPRGFSLGLGRKVMDYLTDNEKTASFLSGLSEASGVGHVIPNHQKLLRIGIKGVIQEIENKKGKMVKQDDREATDKIDFYQSSINALYGVSQYIRNYGKLAWYLSQQTSAFNSRQILNLQKIHSRMEKIAEHKPETLEEAAQLIFSMHCCLHLIGQPVAVGRLDQLLQPFILKIPKDESSIQEVIDCLWIKFGERVVFNSHFAKDVYRQGSCAVPYNSDGNFPHGDCINQWVQQITVGGYKASNTKTPESGCNVITKLCLKAARRLPLNAPCLSLRVNKLTSKEILKEATKALLSGGAHPIILQDDRILSSLQKTPTFSGKPISLKDSRDIGCDGCYEPLVVGKSEFAFCYLPLLKVLEQTINHGTNYINAGNGYLSGTPSSFLYKPEAQDIKSFDKVKTLFEKHYEIGIRSSIYNLLRNYGNIGKYCPAPLLSSLIDGCIETGRDIYRGGAEHRFIACMFIGFSNCIDSLYAIQKLCFDPVTACVSLEEMRHALLNDWGYDMIPPFSDERTGKDQIEDKSSYYKKLRQRVILFPKFGKDSGRDNKDIKELVDWLANLIVSKFRDVVTSVDPNDAFYQLMEKLKQEYSTTDAPFNIVFTPGSGTFEGYVGWGLGLGASADGRRKGRPISSDFSATPSVQDGPIYASENKMSTLKSWNIDAINEGFSNGAEIDLKIHEDFPEERLQQVLEDFSKGKDIGGNILTFTCVDRDTFENAIKFPEKYDLIRVRTGGWSEFFQTFYDAHKQQQMRRPYYSPD